jgi:undecaprenyl-diphosphatase
MALSPLSAALLGVIEGLTEYLPVSSTGHLILAGELLHLDGDGAKSFEIVIQLGAILAVVVQYRALLGHHLRGLLARESASLRLAGALCVGFAPVAVAGLLLRKTIKAHLFGPLPVAGALIVGGAVMLGVERLRRAAGPGSVDTGGLEQVTLKRALLVGLGQCLSLWPGASRSMCTILSGQLAGLPTSVAAEFSFLLALPTLGAATLYELWKGRQALLDGTGPLDLVIGLVVSFVVAWGVIAGFIQYLKRRGLAPFGVYRILLGLAVFWLVAR